MDVKNTRGALGHAGERSCVLKDCLSLYPANGLAQFESNVDYTPYDFIGNVGGLIILVTYLLLQMERIDPKGVGYSIWNGLGSTLVLVSLSFKFNLSSFIIEFFWLLISIFGLYQCWRRSR